MFHRLTIHSENLITRPQTGHIGGSALFHESDGRVVDLALRLADHPNNQSHREGETEAEKWTCGGDDDFVERFDRRKVFAGVLRLALHGFHGRELRDCDEAARRNRAEPVFHAVDRFAPNRLAEPDGEFFHHQTAPTGGQEVPEFVHHNEEVENQQNLEADDKKLQSVE